MSITIDDGSGPQIYQPVQTPLGYANDGTAYSADSAGNVYTAPWQPSAGGDPAAGGASPSAGWGDPSYNQGVQSQDVDGMLHPDAPTPDENGNPKFQSECKTCKASDSKPWYTTNPNVIAPGTTDSNAITPPAGATLDNSVVNPQTYMQNASQISAPVGI
jgi:hypothetical protein